MKGFAVTILAGVSLALPATALAGDDYVGRESETVVFGSGLWRVGLRPPHLEPRGKLVTTTPTEGRTSLASTAFRWRP